jgi:hypothetical protein
MNNIFFFAIFGSFAWQNYKKYSTKPPSCAIFLQKVTLLGRFFSLFSPFYK